MERFFPYLDMPRPQGRWLRLLTLVIVLAALTVCFTAAWADAASLRVCFNVGTQTDLAAIEFNVDAKLYDSNLLMGATTVDPAIFCKILPLTNVLVRGVDSAATIVGVNAIGERGPASAPVTFRVPSVPGVLLAPTVQLVTP